MDKQRKIDYNILYKKEKLKQVVVAFQHNEYDLFVQYCQKHNLPKATAIKQLIRQAIENDNLSSDNTLQ